MGHGALDHTVVIRHSWGTEFNSCNSTEITTVAKKLFLEDGSRNTKPPSGVPVIYNGGKTSEYDLIVIQIFLNKEVGYK